MAIRIKRVQLVPSEQEMADFKEYAQIRGVVISEILRDYVQSLIASSQCRLLD